MAQDRSQLKALVLLTLHLRILLVELINFFIKLHSFLVS
jgi:hypothetical protein